MIKKLLIKNGHVIDPVNEIDGRRDILISGGRIEKIASVVEDKEAETIDAAGQYVCPGFIDMHVHLREPGREDEETIASGTRAAAHGGFTTILCMPNTEPPVDNEGLVDFVYKQARDKGVVNVYCAGCITKGRAGKELVEMAALKEAGVIAVTDDGSPVADSQLMRCALEYSAMCGLRVICHSEDMVLSSGGQMNEGYMATVLGLKGIPNAAEENIVYRDILLAKLTGVPVHIAHVSTAGSVELIRRAKADGVKVTCETAPHYFALDDSALKTYDTNLKVNPPIRSVADVNAVRQGLKDGAIDAIATDHAPHADHEKEMEFSLAPPGLIGLETAVGLALDKLVNSGFMDINTLVARFTAGPRGILNISQGALTVGASADITFLDINKQKKVNKKEFYSKSGNTPFDGWMLRGAVAGVMVGGNIIFHSTGI